MAKKQDFTVFSGNDVTLKVVVADADNDNEPLNLAGAQAMIWQLAKKVSAQPIITKSLGSGVTITSAPDGELEIALDAGDLEPLKGEFYHELRLTNSLGKKSTLMYGAVSITQNLVDD